MKKILFPFFAILACFQFAYSLQWSSPPAVISSPGINASHPEIAVDSNGNGAALWIENAYIKSSYFTSGGSWSSPVTLSGSGASSPKITMDGSGNATALWMESGVVKSSVLPFGGSWGTAVALSSSGASSAQISVDGSGNAVAIWARDGNIESVSKLSGGSWSTTPDVFMGPDASNPWVGVNGGNVVAVWHTLVDGVNYIYSSAKAVGGTWNSPQYISYVFQNSVLAKVALDPNGNAVAVWFIYNVSGDDYSDVTVLSASLPNGGYWSYAVEISGSGIRNPADLALDISLDPNGNAVAVWTMSYDGSLFNIETSTLPFNAYWSSVVTIDSLDPYAYSADVDVVAAPDACAVYMISNTGISINVARKDIVAPTGVWDLAGTISNYTYNNHPRIDATLIGNTVNGIAVWAGWDGSTGIIQAVTITQSVIQPPTGLAVSQTTNNFGVFTEYQNSVTWVASVSSDTVSYNIYRDGVLIGNVSGLVFVDHNRVPGDEHTYGVASLDAYGSESALAMVTFP